ncbi:MAG TPA: nitrate reductase [Acidimicrobiia bacterium]|nr:nitrate reductase [Acidimicrobiia bacterium]
MGELEAIALALRYPGPDSLEELRVTWAALPGGPVRRRLLEFFGEIENFSLAGWEELHTRTLDLAPIFAPYVGYVVWGENYQRGEFMASLKVAQDEAGIERHGELPDHLEPVLRYLAATDQPLPALTGVFSQAVARMKKTLEKAEADNPYRHVLAALGEVAGRLEVPVGDAR